MTFYAYLHCTPDDVPFYVGKAATLKRVRGLHRNAAHNAIVRQHGAENIGVGYLECSTEDIAFDLERGLIKCLQRSGVVLTNQTSGGEGTHGWEMPEEARQRLSAALKGCPLQEHVKLAVSNANARRVWRPESLAKLSLAAKGRKLSAEHVEKVAAANRGQKRSAETCAKIGAAMKVANTGRKQDADWVARRIAARVATIKARKAKQ